MGPNVDATADMLLHLQSSLERQRPGSWMTGRFRASFHAMATSFKAAAVQYCSSTWGSEALPLVCLHKETSACRILETLAATSDSLW